MKIVSRKPLINRKDNNKSSQLSYTVIFHSIAMKFLEVATLPSFYQYPCGCHVYTSQFLYELTILPEENEYFSLVSHFLRETSTTTCAVDRVEYFTVCIKLNGGSDEGVGNYIY